MTDRRPKCRYPHPDFPGRLCRRVLGEEATRPWRLRCTRCGRMNVDVDTAKADRMVKR